MPDVEEAVWGVLDKYRKQKKKCPVMLWSMSGQRVAKCLYRCYADLLESSPAVLKKRYQGGFPTLSVLLHRLNYKKVPRNSTVNLDLPERGSYKFLFAVCGYPPTCADFGMAYRSRVKYVIQCLSRTTYACWKISQNGEPNDRKELTIEDHEAGRKILKANGSIGGYERKLKSGDLYDFRWLKKFLAPEMPGSIRVKPFYEEKLTEGISEIIGGGDGLWHSHGGVTYNSDLCWAIIGLYTSFTWGCKLPTYRGTGGNHESGESKWGMFLDGLNVSALLLDPNLKPCAWAVNTNKINRTLHAETALVLAWLKGKPDIKTYRNYTFISPWRSCCMCSAWISDVYEGCDVVWFIDDPGLPIRHLDHRENGTVDIFLPSELKEHGTMSRLVMDNYPWFHGMGSITHYDYNNNYLADLKKYLTESKRLTKDSSSVNPTPGPVDLFKSASYFDQLTKAWEASQSIPGPVMDFLKKTRQLKSYVNNILALRRCILSFDP